MIKGGGQGIMKRKHYWPQVSFMTETLQKNGSNVFSLHVTHNYKALSLYYSSLIYLLYCCIVVLRPR